MGLFKKAKKIREGYYVNSVGPKGGDTRSRMPGRFMMLGDEEARSVLRHHISITLKCDDKARPRDELSLESVLAHSG